MPSRLRAATSWSYDEHKPVDEQNKPAAVLQYNQTGFTNQGVDKLRLTFATALHVLPFDDFFKGGSSSAATAKLLLRGQNRCFPVRVRRAVVS